MAVVLTVLVDEKLSNISPNFVEPFMKDRFHWFNITTITSKATREKLLSFSIAILFSYATMMQNYNTEWPSAEALKEHIGGLIVHFQSKIIHRD